MAGPILPELKQLLGPRAVRAPGFADLRDATEAQGLARRADAVALPETVEQVAALLAWCCERRVPLVPRGGRTGFAGGAVRLEGGVVVSLERMARLRALDRLQWRIHVEGGLT